MKMPMSTDAAPKPAARRPDCAAPMRLSLLGATGSIGTSTLDLVAADPERFEVEALTAANNVERLAEIAVRFRARHAVIADERRYPELVERLSGTGPKAGGPNSLSRYAIERALSVNITAQGGDPALLNL